MDAQSLSGWFARIKKPQKIRATPDVSKQPSEYNLNVHGHAASSGEPVPQNLYLPALTMAANTP